MNIANCALLPVELPALPSVTAKALRGAYRLALPMGVSSGSWAHVLDFEADAFDPSAFVASGIACPESVARSVSKRQAEFFFGRLAARLGLHQLGLHTSRAEAEIGIGSFRQPTWPLGVIGSITHCDGRAGALVLDARLCSGVGIDLERRVGASERAALLDTAIFEEEAAHLRAQGGLDEFDMLLTLLFSAKESLFKGAFMHVGRYFDYSAVHLSALDIERRRLTLTVRDNLGEQFPVGRQCELHFLRLDSETILTSFAWRRNPAPQGQIGLGASLPEGRVQLTGYLDGSSH